MSGPADSVELGHLVGGAGQRVDKGQLVGYSGEAVELHERQRQQAGRLPFAG